MYLKIRFTKKGDGGGVAVYHTNDLRFFETREDVYECVQNVIKHGYFASTYLAVCRTMDSTTDKIPQQSFYKKEWEKAKTRQKNFQLNNVSTIRKVVKFITNHKKTVVLYGTGHFFNIIVNELIRQDAHDYVIGVMDRDPNLLDENIRGYRVYHTDAINNNRQAKYVIIAATPINQKIIYKRIKPLMRSDISIIKLDEFLKKDNV